MRSWILLLIPVALPPVHAADTPLTLHRETLRDAMPVAAMLDEPVHLADGREIGELTDVLIAANGNVREFLVDFEEIDESWNRGAVSFADDVADYDEPPLYEAESMEGELEGDYLAVPSAQLRYAQDRTVVRLGLRSLSKLPRRDAGVSGLHSGIYASDVIGLDVDLGDERGFGEVDDVLLDANGGKVLAYVVQSWDGLLPTQYALPAASASFERADREGAIRENYGIEALRFPYSRQQVAAMPEYDAD